MSTPESQEVEITVKLRFVLPTEKDGEILEAEDYCEETRNILLAAFKDVLAETENSADAVDILECREEGEIYSTTQEQAFDRVRAGMVELQARMNDLEETLDK